MHALRKRLESAYPDRFESFLVHFSLPSTHRELLRRPPPGPGRYHVCVTQEQTAGQARQGRSWHSRADHSLTFSLSRGYPPGKKPDTRLPLLLAIGVLRALRTLGCQTVGIKWPNDLLEQRSKAKLAGILVEGQPGPGGGMVAWLAGVGLNLGGSQALQVERAVTDLQLLTAQVIPPEAVLWAVLLDVMAVWEQFLRDGFAVFAEEYAANDLLLGQVVHWTSPPTSGIARGIDPGTGALRVEMPDGSVRKITEEVHLTAALPSGAEV